MKNLRDVFASLAETKRRAFVGYVTAGDPSLEATRTFVHLLDKMGTDIIELGVPFSDPVADGPVNQRASERALNKKTSLKDILSLAEILRKEGMKRPIVIFSYLNPLMRMGWETFAKTAREKGVTGVLAVDLPPEEAGQWVKVLKNNLLETVFLASPTTSVSRLNDIQLMTSGFVYYVSRTGVTGVRKHLSQTLKQELRQVRKVVKKPIAVGFGISNPDHIRQVAELADGVIVGSAIGEVIERHGRNVAAARNALTRLLKPMIKTAHGEPKC